MLKFARVVTDLALDRVFDYKIPDSLKETAVPGARVEVPFGHTRKTGFIVSITDYSDYPHHRIKPISKVIDKEPLIPHTLIKLGEWVARYYCCSIEQGIKVLLPGVVRGGNVKKKTQLAVKLTNRAKAEKELKALQEKHPKQALVLKKLFQRGETLLSVLKYELGISDSAVNTLEKKGLVVKENIEIQRDPFASDNIIPSCDLDLNDEQSEALDVIKKSIDSQKGQVTLLNGVTGSGKTEVYLQAIRHCLEKGQEAIVMVPEIALTPQTVERFRSRFGDRVSVLHSGLTDGERFDEWMKIHEKKVSIAVGARSALFAPFHNLGMIIVDEEHEATYKQNEAPRYHARDIAVVRGHMENSAVVLGSATPSFETLYNVKSGRYTEVKLQKRFDSQPMPEVSIINLKNESKEVGSGYGVFSKLLVSDIYKCLDQGEQVILFLNRRGFATTMQCLKCGYVAECEHCSKTYTYHRNYNQLICHYCNDIHIAPDCCPDCGDKEIRFSGLGTEKVESMAKKIFPSAEIARMDSDTMSSEKDYRAVLQRFRSGKVDILIGTQMIAKGLHFPNVTLVGVMLADLGLHIPDFRAGERTLQLLTQVAGRAGRGEIPGRVLIQTLSPFHPALQCAMKHEYEPFFEEEIGARKLFYLPPDTHMILIHFSGEDESIVSAAAIGFADALKRVLKDDEETQLGDAMPSPIEKVAGKFRYQIGIRTKKVMKVSLILRQAVVGNRIDKRVKFYVDVDPYSLM